MIPKYSYRTTVTELGAYNLFIIGKFNGTLPKSFSFLIPSKKHTELMYGLMRPWAR